MNKIIWKSTPHFIVLAPAFVLCMVLSLIAGSLTTESLPDQIQEFFAGYSMQLLHAPIWLFFLYVLLQNATTHYIMTDEVLILKKGILNQKEDHIELYRVKDYQILRPIWLRIFSLASILIYSSDQNNPKVILVALSNVNEKAKDLRNRVDTLRVSKRVYEVD